MEDRIAAPRAGRPGGALVALVVILAITAAWWALALWPAGAAEPEWLSRTRAVCFGAGPGGLPDAGGWILLLGEPAGMIGVLVAVWGDSLRRDLRWIGAQRARKAVASAVVILGLIAAGLLAGRIASAWRRSHGGFAATGSPRRVDQALPALSLVDQQGRRVSLAELGGQTTLVTFAFGHCVTVCPVIVSDLRAARRAAHRPDVPLVVVTLDPWRDTPDRLPGLAAHWGLAASDRVLSGSIAEVGRPRDRMGNAGRRQRGGSDVLVDRSQSGVRSLTLARMVFAEAV